MKLSVVIPAYNEEKDIQAAVMDVVESYPDAEIIVVNDASTDYTYRELVNLKLTYLTILNNDRNMGHGYSVVRGLKVAGGDYILYIDADRQISLKHLAEIKESADIISGWRIHRHDKLFRKVISFCLKTTILCRFGYYMKDANCPFKLYKRETIQPLLEKLPKTYIIPIADLQVLAKKEGLSLAWIQTPHKPYDGVRQGFLQVPDLKAWKFFASAFFEIIKI